MFRARSLRLLAAVLIMVVGVATCANAQAFVDAGSIIPFCSGGSVAGGDFDNDGDLDLLITGYHSRPFTDIFRNEGAGIFTNLFPGPFETLAGVCFGDAAWADFDNDGYLDFVVSGATSLFGTGPSLFKTFIYRNNRNGTFAAVTNLPGILNGSIGVGDWDNDGHRDVLLAGSNDVRRGTMLYRNNGNGAFSDSFVTLPQVSDSSAAWADFDHDGDLDLVLAGLRAQTPSTLLFANDGHGQFSEVATALPGMYDGAVAWGDVDNDGWIDLLLSGDTSGPNVTAIFRNDGAGNFLPVGSALPGLWKSDVQWGDFDSDCDLDFLITGSDPTATQHQTSIYQNSGATFNLLTNLAPVRFRSLAWGDWDGDGDIDIITASDSRLFRNVGSGSHSLPTPPQNLSASVNENNSVELTWSSVNPGCIFGYNLRVGTGPGMGDIVSPAADAATGMRRSADFGNGPSAGVWKLNNLEAGTYYWSVQAIAGTLAGSVFAPESTFVVTNNTPFISTLTNLLVAPNEIATLSATINDTETPADALSLIAWSSNTNLIPHDNIRFTRNGTNWLIILVSATNQTGSATIRITVTDANGASAMREFDVTVQYYSSVLSLSTTQSSVDSHWADFNGDGRLDLLRSANTVYRNTGLDFAPVLSGLSSTLDGAVVADADRDGDLDIFQLVSFATSPLPPGLFLNHPDSRFRAVTNLGVVFPPLRNTSAAWGDYDNDGRNDLVLMGTTNTSTQQPWGFTRLYHASSNLTLTPSGIALRQLSHGMASWADFDNDGDLDLTLCGRSRTNPPVVTILYRNDYGTNFVELPSSLLGLSGGSLSGASLHWGDMDNDGDLDLLTAGTRADGTNSARVYRNDGEGILVDSNAGLADNEGSSASWGDFNNDGLLDILRGPGGPAVGARIYINQGEGKFLGINTGVFRSTTDGIAAWGDMDNNGTLDLINGFIDSSVTLYRNNSFRTNQPPGAPLALRSNINSHGTVLLEWDPAVDPDQDGGLTYSVRIGTSSGAENVLPGGAHLQTGRPLLPAIGNCGSRTSHLIKGLPPGQYYWSAQALDHGYAGSHFAPEATFLIPSQILDAGFTNQHFALSYVGLAGRSYVLDVSSDLTSWSPVTTNALPSGIGTLIDTRPPTGSASFYRIRLLP